MEAFLGAFMIYSFIHLIILQKKAWIMRTNYERFITLMGFFTAIVALLYLGGIQI